MTKRVVVFLCAGMNGRASACSYLKSQIEKKHRVLVHVCRANWPRGRLSYFRTKEGVNVGGRRLAEEMRKVVEENDIGAISVVGISLGGLYLRYALGLLLAELAPTRTLQLLSFISLGTPHLGVCRGLSKVHNWAAQNLLGLSGKQILLQDDQLLLLQMTQHDSCFMEALSRFQHRFAYAIRQEDSGQVPFNSAAILPFHSEEMRINSTGISKEFPHIIAQHFTPSLQRTLKMIDDNETETSSVSDCMDEQNLDIEWWEMKMLQNLRAIGWTHIEVQFDSWLSRKMSHNNMAVNTQFLNFPGKDVARHVCQNICNALDEYYLSARACGSDNDDQEPSHTGKKHVLPRYIRAYNEVDFPAMLS